MAGKSVLLKLSPEAHAQVLAVSERHQRSMQKLLVALIEGWLAQGAPDPVEFTAGPGKQAQEPERVDFVNTVDQQAREVIDLLAQRTKALQDALQELQAWRETVDRPRGTGGFSGAWKGSSGGWQALVREAADASASRRRVQATQRSDRGSNPHSHSFDQERVAQLQNDWPGLINTLRP